MRSFRFLTVALAAVLLAGTAFAGVDAKDIPSISGKGVPAVTGVNIAASEPFVGVVIFWESDDTSPYDGPTAATLDTGTEACAVYGLSCAETYTFAVAGAAGDEVVDSACATDLANDTLALSFCY